MSQGSRPCDPARRIGPPIACQTADAIGRQIDTPMHYSLSASSARGSGDRGVTATDSS